MIAVLFATLLPYAAPEPVAVIARVVSPSPTDASAAELFEGTHRVLSTFPGLRAISREELAGSIGRPLEEELRACGPDVACVSARLESAEVTWAILVVANFELDPALLSAVIVRAGERAPAGRIVEELGSSVQSALQPGLHRALLALGYTPGGRVTLLLDPPDAIAAVDGRPLAADGDALAAGRHLVEVSREGYDARSVELLVEPGGTQSVEVKLESSSSWWASPWPWIGVGVVVAGGVVAAVMLSESETYRLCLPAAGGNCQAP